MIFLYFIGIFYVLFYFILFVLSHINFYKALYNEDCQKHFKKSEIKNNKVKNSYKNIFASRFILENNYEVFNDLESICNLQFFAGVACHNQWLPAETDHALS